ncbi:hypothetical protein [Planococcus shixiaomingii]|uniref:hypothetical protein n=1 Tax=Planococcus shixiaomingii TaxID=3058393 RepID=UPI0026072FF6|nr:hypothetical protein [Planococcus sp. N022]WKA53183.1 hypothetical protein QWY21_10975 [Planococcus sp. N022]
MSPLDTTTSNFLFTARDIAEPLASVTMEEYDEMQKYFYVENFDVIGFQENGRVTGFIDKNNIVSDEEIINAVKKFDIHDLITPNTDIRDCLKLLENRNFLFIIDQSQVTGIVTAADRQKPAVRMMLFGIITIFESQLASLIHLKYPENRWGKLISESRLDKANELYSELLEKNLDINLITCTQICDKTDIVLKDPILLSSLTGLSKTKAKEFFNRIQELRNNLAHANSLQHWFENENILNLVDQVRNITDNIKKQLR